MRRLPILSTITTAGLALLASSAPAQAQCAFEHPNKAKTFQVSFVQAFVPCNEPGGNVPNVAANGGLVPACQPPETFNEQAGSPANGWLWGPTSSGTVQIRPGKSKLPPSALNPSGNSGDLLISMNLKGIVDGAPGPASGNGTLAIVTRTTMEDRANGDLTIVESPTEFGFPLTAGTVKMKTSYNVLLNGSSKPSLPMCASVEIVSVRIRDANDNVFASGGILTPNDCLLQHPTSAKTFGTSFVQAFVPCDDPEEGGSPPNTTTEGGDQACAAPETFNDLDGSPSDGWHWGPGASGQLGAKPGTNKVVHPNNPPGDTADILLTMTLSGILDGTGGPASGPGAITALARTTFDDRDLGDLTLIDFPALFPFTLTAGKVKHKTSANAALNNLGQPGLPLCSSLEFLDLQIFDANSNAFAAAGLFIRDN